jgi:hypothetical protein
MGVAAVITNPDDPKFDIEKLVAKWEKDLAQTSPVSLSLTIRNTVNSPCTSRGLATLQETKWMCPSESNAFEWMLNMTLAVYIYRYGCKTQLHVHILQTQSAPQLRQPHS